jgi:penicillin V acylase-like amidase (Ntn superfamily)
MSVLPHNDVANISCMCTTLVLQRERKAYLVCRSFDHKLNLCCAVFGLFRVTWIFFKLTRREKNKAKLEYN